MNSVSPAVSCASNNPNLDAYFNAWLNKDWVRPLDVEFAHFIHELSPDTSPSVLVLALLTSLQVGRGHVCLDLAQMFEMGGDLSRTSEASVVDGNAKPEQIFTEFWSNHFSHKASVDTLRQLLVESKAVSDGSKTTPLVLVDGRLYLHRFWRFEQQIADGIRQRLSQPSTLERADSNEAQILAQALNVLFETQSEPDFQKIACALAARSHFSIITGGPGTGKTTTVVKLLAALQSVASKSSELHESPKSGRKLRIRLAAPTGKAAARLNESISNAVNALRFDLLPGNLVAGDIPTKVTTLHRLLGSRPNTRKFKHDQSNPLLLDILVIDEASMVDIDMLSSVFLALPDSAHLILLGDKDQLASVDAGAVLGALCSRASQAHYSDDTASWLKDITGYDVPAHLKDPQGNRLDQSIGMLRKSYRFDAQSGIRKLADAVNQNDQIDALLDQCRNRVFDDVSWLGGHASNQTLDAVQNILQHHCIDGSPEAYKQGGMGRMVNNTIIDPPVGYRHYLSLLKNHTLDVNSPMEDWDNLARSVLKAFNDFQILCVLRHGPLGVEGLNILVAEELKKQKLIDKTEGWYVGRPILITSNDYNLSLMNGDIGITIMVPWDETEEGEPRNTLRVVFPTGDGQGIRWISPARLGQMETVYAMTVHKSQGSEFTHCALVLPDRMSPVLTRELIYTGITRAKTWFSLIAPDKSIVTTAVSRRVERSGGPLFDT